ncbi:MAG TPA: hypothetical protein VD766_03530 [Solirubrobacterales bacterium]|nr:hypothetical protein [Solirubrobacterales bacterium]
MRRGIIVLSIAAGIHLCVASSSLGGGTVVNGPANATEADCTPGARPSFEGFGDDTLIVLGCVRPAGSAPVVVAADNSDAYACFYVAPPGAQDGGPCTQVRSTGGKFGGPLTAAKQSASPVTGGRDVAALRIGQYRAGVYVSGQVPSSVERVWVTGHGPYRSAELLPIPESLGSRIGATHPFSVFVARVPADVDTCAGIQVVARGSDGTISAEYKKSDRAFPSGPVALPGSRGCVDGAGGIAASLKMLAAVVREVSLLMRIGA